MVSIPELLADYKIGKVLQEFKARAPESTEDWYGYIIAHVLTGNLEEAQGILKENKELLQDLGLYAILHFEVEYQQSSDVSSLLYQVLSSPTDHFPDYVRADLNFIIGFYFLREKNLPAAKAFYDKALTIYKTLKHSSALWRVEFNLHLVESFSMKDGRHALPRFEELMEQRESLNIETQVYTARFLIWYLLFLGEFQRAKELIIGSLEQAKLLDNSLARQQIEKYFAYVDFCFRKKSTNEKTLSPQENFHPNAFTEAVDVIETISMAPAEKILSVVEGWKHRLNIAERYMLLDMFLDLLATKGMQEKIIELFSLLESQTQVFQSLIFFPRSLYWHVIIAYEKLDRSQQMPLEYFFKFSQASSQFHMKSLEDFLHQIRKSRRKIYIDTINNEIEAFGKKFSFPREGKAFFMLFILKRAGDSCSVKFLLQSIYKEASLVDGSFKLKALVRRFNAKLGKKNLIQIRDKTVFLSKDFQWILKNERVDSQKHRHRKIKELLNRHPQGFSSAELNKVILASPRTLLCDLKTLADKGMIVKLGAGKKTIYRAQYKN